MASHIYFCLVVVLIALSSPVSVSGLSIPKIFGNGMVLQAAPQQAQVWGGLDGVDSEVQVRLQCQSGEVQEHTAKKAENSWSVILDPVPETDICEISVSQEGQTTLDITDVLFGDVWVCSGQSNMEWPMSKIFNATEEIAALADFDKIRIYHLARMTSPNPEEDFISPSLPDHWTKTDDSANVGRFSAICLLFAKELSQRMGNKAFGLIESNWGGTRVEPWMTPEALSFCSVPDHEDSGSPQNSNSYIYNAMIHPIIKFTITGAIWYQGESNRSWNKDLYGCTFPTLISEWRRKWSENSPTDSTFPFGFVQLAAWKENYNGSEFPVIRWHQTADLGYVPNLSMPRVFMAVSIDTFDRESGIHPRNKQLTSSRLATAGLNVAYGQTEFPSQGPFPVSVQFSSAGLFNVAEIAFDEPITFDIKESSGFYYCCQVDYDACDSSNAWAPVVSDIFYDSEANVIVVPIESCSTGFAYLWNETPVLGTEALAIYSDNAFHLPAGPWKSPVQYTRKVEIVI